MAFSEEDTKVKLIDPKIHECGWIEDYIIREYKIADDRFFVEGEDFKKLPTKKSADYVLKFKEIVVAVLEAKAENVDPEKHLSQAQDYGKRLDVPFVYISNGKQIILYDRRTNKKEYPNAYLKPEDIYNAYTEWKKLSKVKTDALNHPYHISGSKTPRAYQDTAIKRVIESISKGNKNNLLTMATGTGKTYVSFQIIWKLVRSKQLHRVLFLTDRIFLKDQAYNEFEPFRQGSRDDRCKIEGGNFNKNRNIYFSTYQTLFTNDLYKKIPENFFDLIVIDECHRSRYGDWGVVLDHFADAFHLGMTATPKREDNIDVYEYFGESVYEYSLGQAIEDGYLVPYKIYKITTNLDKLGLNVNEAEEVIYDDEIEPKDIKDFYEPSEYERAITVPDRTELLSNKVTELLDKTDPNGKTIIFCVDMAHAQDVKDKLNQIKNDEDFATRIVSEDKDDMAKFRDKEMPKPVIATTVDLLSTGINIPHLRNIVFMRPISSRVLFKQIIGRGSRLFDGKGFFRIIDFTNASRLIDEWDIPKPIKPPVPPEEPKEPKDKFLFGIVVDNKTEEAIDKAEIKIKKGRWAKNDFTGEDGVFKCYGIPSNDTVNVAIDKDGYKPLYKKLKPQINKEETAYILKIKPERVKPRKIRIEGIVVNIAEEVEVEFEGEKLSFAEYRKYSKEEIKQKIHTSDQLKEIWMDIGKRERLIKDLEAKNVSVRLIKSVDNLEDSDSFDVIAHIAFNAPLLTREDRVKNFVRENKKEIDSLGNQIRDAISDILDKYKNSGEENLTADVFLGEGMYAKKQSVKDEFPKGLSGFMKFMKEKVYENVAYLNK